MLHFSFRINHFRLFVLEIKKLEAFFNEKICFRPEICRNQHLIPDGTIPGLFSQPPPFQSEGVFVARAFCL
jgi:hypothetical protein